MYRIVVWAIALLSVVALQAQQNVGTYKETYTWQYNTLIFPATRGVMKLEFCTPGMFRVRYSFDGTFKANESYMVVNYQWKQVSATVTERRDRFVITTSEIKVEVQKADLRVSVSLKDGKLLMADKEVSAYKNGDTVGSIKQLQPDEHVFGFGERMDFLDRRSKHLRLNVGRGQGLPHEIGAYNILEANYSPVPFFISTKGYGLFLHNAYASEWDMGAAKAGEYSFKAEGGELDYYFIYGPTFSNILNSYTALTGKTPLLPRFAFGLHVGTYSGGTWGHEELTSDAYVIELARKLRAMGIPVDLLWLDSTWRIFGEVGGKGATSFEWRETFTDPKGMFDSLYAMHYNMVGLHLRPRFDNGKKLKLLDTAQQLKYTYPEENYAGEFVNFFDTTAVDWWWNHGVKRVASLGAKFLKTDEGSAFGAMANDNEKIGPTGKHINELHNLFPVAYAKGAYEQFQKYNGIRGLNQTREGFAGIQRYPFIFAGDWPSEWQYFAPVIKAGLNIGISGVGQWSHCMGGFEHQADPELYIRWVQFGMFSPVSMVFGMDHPGYKEPWNYGDNALRNFKKYDSLRYQLLPYIYSSAWQNYVTGMPLMRALVLQYQNDENVYEISDEYMFGDNLLVCPVTTKGAQTRSIYLPEGDWFNYWTGKAYKGKQYVHVVTPLDTIPLFVKAGAIIPSQPAMLYCDEKAVDEITLDIYPGANGGYTLYEDDGKSQAYKNGQYAVTAISTTWTNANVSVQVKKPEGKFAPATHNYLVKLHAAKKPVNVSENKAGVLASTSNALSKGNWYYNETEQILYIRTKSVNTATINIEAGF
ncbi:Alpha-glucosidase, glycosyl hydrolase family GH31 [Filimonas lacunae]|uniref:Alpha-glucosidase, glycosyl hydrolase family GH31 n=1 Tax=Filimonas lacunae TaxID=477680 RepID=A0A173MMY7_9BACT|nr:TIM-barrel domain-containing protein [Filimonas lacunae]BAV08847.1 alpha-glucosidase [Filimonas lacunae]SIS62700.1 Alpha-glucosidase, glycosyl hydrolase family GH31 [Filimonas lacunae]